MPNKIISFSLYGTHEVYQVGALRNLALQPLYYPGWICRFYVSQEVPADIVRRLEQGGAEVVHKQRRDYADGLFWRFLAAADPDLDAVIVRDADSRLSERERCAVEAWLRGDKGFHIIRDHPLHLTLIPGGTWGCRGGVFPDMAALNRRWQWHDVKGRDQEFLTIYVYPRIKQNVLIHTDLVKYEGETVHPFPCPRRGYEFVGEIVSVNEHQGPAANRDTAGVD